MPQSAQIYRSLGFSGVVLYNQWVTASVHPHQLSNGAICYTLITQYEVQGLWIFTSRRNNWRFNEFLHINEWPMLIENKLLRTIYNVDLPSLLYYFSWDWEHNSDCPADPIFNKKTTAKSTYTSKTNTRNAKSHFVAKKTSIIHNISKSTKDFIKLKYEENHSNKNKYSLY